MVDNKAQKKDWRERIRESYKVIVYRSDDFGEVRRFDLSLASIYTWVSIGVVSTVVLFSILIAFTPIRKLIPGYGDIEVNERFLSIIDQVNELSSKVEAQEVYLNGMRNLLSAAAAGDNITSMKGNVSNSKIQPKTMTTSTTDVDVVESDLLLISSTDERAQLFTTLTAASIIKPVDGVISSHFQPAIQHYGIDILGPKNTPVRSMMDGYVFSSGWDLETGYTIGVQHAGNVLTFYKHNSTLLKEKGAFVKAGEAIAIIGNTGTLSNGPHLHFELWHNGKPVNPIDIINF